MLFYHEDVLLLAHVLEYFWPYGGGDLADVGLFQDAHEGAGLADASADTERDLTVQDRLVVWQL
jgi:hypothetical protein